jgi:hypothetical protein
LEPVGFLLLRDLAVYRLIDRLLPCTKDFRGTGFSVIEEKVKTFHDHRSRADHIDHRRNKGQSGNRAADMSTCFPALRYNYVHSALDRPACHVGRGDSVQHDRARFLGTAHQSTRAPGSRQKKEITGRPKVGIWDETSARNRRLRQCRM